ncbi:response regulator [Spirosoma luteum]|uniref:response regulator n=1 Tax=Spirosoma luteum TaxID=431553 RepID=UPI00037DBA57|nr:response regulator [Spirosoma luteum]
MPTYADKPLILIVDDNRDATLLLGRLLELSGYTVHTCNDGQAGLEAAEQLRPVGVLLDLAMPGLDGYAVCRLIRAQPWGERMLLIAVSGYSSETDQQRSYEAGFDWHLVKPVHFDTLTGLLLERLPPQS